MFFGNFNFGNPFESFQSQHNPSPQTHFQPRANQNVPPASQRCIQNLQNVKITVDDLLEETNKECLVCLEAHNIGGFACKLPCGHLYHKSCLIEWLEKHATCPVCRYELETNDLSFEADRKSRMKKRKLRIRRDELELKSIPKLRELTSSLSINIENCLDKCEIIENIISSGKVEITEGAPASEMSRFEFESKGVKELRHLLLSFGLPTDGALEKSELRNRLLESGRIILAPDPEEHPDRKSEASISPSTSSTPPSSSPLHGMTPDSIRNSPLSTLRNICQILKIDTKWCVDKRDVVDLILPHLQSPLEPEKGEKKSPTPDSIFLDEKYELKTDLPKSTVDDSSTLEYPKHSFSSPLTSSTSSSSSDSSYSTSSSSFNYSTNQFEDQSYHQHSVPISLTMLLALSLKELIHIAQDLMIPLTGCVEKEDIIEQFKPKALKFYQQTFHGEIIATQTFGASGIPVPEQDKDKIIHSVLSFDDNVIMISDTQHTSAPVQIGNNIHLSLNMENVVIANSTFKKLSEGGNVLMPFEKQNWGAHFGMIEDKFGIIWMLNCLDEKEVK